MSFPGAGAAGTWHEPGARFRPWGRRLPVSDPVYWARGPCTGISGADAYSRIQTLRGPSGRRLVQAASRPRTSGNTEDDLGAATAPPGFPANLRRISLFPSRLGRAPDPKSNLGPSIAIWRYPFRDANSGYGWPDFPILQPRWKLLEAGSEIGRP